MDVIKKNIGLILSVLVCLVLSVFLIIEIVVNKGKLGEVEKKVDSEVSFFDKVRKSKLRILPDSGVVVNVVQAQKNAEKAEAAYKELCKNLGTKYQIVPKLPSTSPEAIRWIRENLQEMAEYAVRHGVMIQDLGREFNMIVSQGNLAADEFRTVFRMLYVYRRVVEILAEAGVKNVNEINWPLQFAVHDVDRYTVTPINISITGDGDVIQTFLNKMSSDTKMLFFLKTLSIVSTDQFGQAVAKRAKLESEQAKDKNMLPQEKGRNQGDLFASADSKFDNVLDKKLSSGEYPEHWVKLEPIRQDRLGYVPPQVSLKARFDLLEFKVDEK